MSIKKKIIYGCESRGDAESPYLTRYTLLETKCGNLYLHVFHRSDGDELHDHPWPFISLPLWRGYIEETHVGTEELSLHIVKRRKTPGMILFRRPEHRHRVELVNGKPAVTLVWAGNKVREWGFFTVKGWQQWQAYFKEKGC